MRPLRRADRQVTDQAAIDDIFRRSDVCRLAFNDPQQGVPYILPLNFGVRRGPDGLLRLYFHGASEGRKYQLLQADPRVAFELDCRHRLLVDEEKGFCTMAYLSVVGRGTLAEVTDPERKHGALRLIVDKYHPDAPFHFNTEAEQRTRVLELTVEELTAKERPDRMS